MTNANEQALEDFQDGKSLTQYRTAEGSDLYKSAAFVETSNPDERRGIDIVGDATEDFLVSIETGNVREIDGDVLGKEYLDEIGEAFEYNVEVEVYDRDGNKVEEGDGMFVSGTAENVSPKLWADEAVDSALESGGVDKVEGNSATDGGVEYLLDEEEESGLDAIDTV